MKRKLLLILLWLFLLTIGCPIHSVASEFVITIDTTDIEEELITSRILWLKGIVPGLNEGEKVDSYTRYIYIHGTPEEGLIGTPASNGCIRIKNQDIIELFELIPQGTLVRIHE